MTFCDTCKALPFRDLLNLRPEGQLREELFLQCPRPELGAYGGDGKHPFVRWHSSIESLHDASDDCTFCQMVLTRLKGSWHYNRTVQAEETRILWIGMRPYAQSLTVYLGNEKPEVRISGNFWFNSTAGMPIRRMRTRLLLTKDFSSEPSSPLF